MSLPIVVIATHDACFSKQQSVIQQLHARKGCLIVMCSRGDAAAVSLGRACRVIEVPQVDCLQPVVNIVPLQGVRVAGTLGHLQLCQHGPIATSGTKRISTTIRGKSGRALPPCSR
ncbi:glutamine--fructose-6-phosphate aminotransferase [isomerizing]-like [Eucalyptus grandis]|uniref:glutamine--fructose-6-phosphate aminotransferase [isomerizing]-like n=1 Tax=Eucalyptus grandis TaxID=71139 RepID=UPI00192EEA21|nr:glutamine--fructose-6-phosphate aminotransferase [isomerizing]-like [Eucalyptus grandis]